MRTRYLSLDALVLRTREQNEADAWVTLLAPVAGLISGVAKNGLKSQKRFMGALVPVTGGQVLLARRQGVWYLEEALVDQPYSGIKREAVTYALACYAVEQVLVTHPQGTQAADAFPLLVELFDHIESGTADLPLTRLAWDLRLMEGLGLAPHLSDCVSCGMELASAAPAFHGPSGGLLCPADAEAQQHLLPVSRAAVELVEMLMASGFPGDRGKHAAGPRVRKEARAMTDAHMAWHLASDLRSRRVLEQLARLSPRRARP